MVTETEFKNLYLDSSIPMAELSRILGISAFLIRRKAQELGLPMERKRRGRPVRIIGEIYE